MITSLLNRLRRISQGLLAPSNDSCLICGGLQASSSGELPLCRKCYTSIQWIRPEDIVCKVCGRYVNCPDCSRRETTWFEFNLSTVQYDSVMKEWLGRFKYRGDERLQLLFAGMFVSLLHRFLSSQHWTSKDISIVTYVPLSRQRLEERGFNQAELFARSLGAAFGIPVAPLLARALHTGKMSYKSRQERIHDLLGAFVPNDSGVNQLSVMSKKQVQNIILVDDVYTTGSTVNVCAQVIREAVPSSRVYSLTWAR